MHFSFHCWTKRKPFSSYVI
uniref:Uncharacterized protein n=1 Tax=Rhizophora mucronata TaxID=61149 RepID=A0A2P2NYF6_RHIMU